MIRIEFTFEEFCNLPLTYTQGITTTNYAIRHYKNQTYNIVKEVLTPYKSRLGEWGQPIVFYFMPDDKRNFMTIDQLYVAYMEKVCGIKT